VRDALEQAGILVSSAELTRLPKAEVAVTGRTAEKLVKLLEALEALDDVQKVYSNADIDEAVLADVVGS
jgi:transcriptional/translational regulatory protein YebC/TACO1